MTPHSRSPACSPLLVLLLVLGSGISLGLPGCGATGARHAATTATVAGPDGVPIAYDVRGQGEPTLVFVHGWSCDRDYWTQQLDEFAGDHRVVAVDLPGHGQSGKHRAFWSVDGFGDDITAVANALGLQRMILVGHSMGGFASLAAAARMPGRVIGVVGVETLHDAEMVYTSQMLAPVMEGFRADFPGTMSGAIDNMLPRDVDPDLESWIVNRSSRVDAQAALGVFASFAQLDVAGLFRNAGVPVRCINAEGKPPMTYPTQLETNRRYADFDAEFMPGVGHFLMLEEPRAFNSRLEDVIAALEAGAGLGG